MGTGKNGGKWRFFEGQKRHFSVLGAGASKHKPLIWLLLCRPTFLAPESKKNVGRHFSGEDFVDVTRRGRLRPDATNPLIWSAVEMALSGGFWRILGSVHSCVTFS